ncbi:hypothetical protein [Dawidia soli]|uniref:Uncharacterized protein n=1 Tax=Dawidia soli TaxID=2782352 RepID=A0AAP2DDA8_9BACT|nr:hypothetical protein [Dawidia soli]MBT1689237.1 hypothetical protein [Dawidia soli]
MTRHIDLEKVGEKLATDVVAHDDVTNLEVRKKFSDNKRDEEIKNTLHVTFKSFIYVAAVTLMCIFLVRMLHLALPEQCFWLTPDQIQGIDKIFFSSAIGGFIASYFNKYKNV